MKNLEFKLSNKKGCLRRENWKDFVDNEKSVFNKKKNNVCILFVCCNSFKAFSECLSYLDKESNQDFDILVVDNSTDNENIDSFHDIGIRNGKVSVLRPIDNIGGSGGFSIGIEYIISENYDYIILFEDDIIPIDENIITETIKLSSPDNIVFNRNYFLGDSSLPFHLNCYPVNSFKNFGVVDPRMFLSYDDIEISGNIDKAIKSGKYKKIFTNKKYFHPIIKKNGQKIITIYLVSRNSLLKCVKVNSISNIKEFIIGFMNIFYGFSKGFIEGCWNILYAQILGVFDFLFGRFGFIDTKTRLNKLFSYSISIPNEYIYTKNIPESKIQELVGNKLDLFGKLTGGHNCLGNIKCSYRLEDGRKNGLVVAGYFNNLYPFFVLSRNVVCMDSFIFNKKEYEVSIFKSGFSRFHILTLIVSFFLSILLYIPLYFIVFLKILIKKIIK